MGISTEQIRKYEEEARQQYREFIQAYMASGYTEFEADSLYQDAMNMTHGYWLSQH
jgi:hypothetical protein